MMPSHREEELPPAYAAIPADDLSARETSDPSNQYVSSIEQQQLEGPGDSPPEYSSMYGRVDVHQDGMGTEASLTNDGRVNININQTNTRLSSLLVPALRSQWQSMGEKAPHEVPDMVPEFAKDVPPMNVLIQIIGSRGDVQPFIALGQVLRQQYGHRVRVATHPTFKKFVEENGLEFFSLGGDPSELMAFMVKNPGLIPDKKAMMSGDIQKRRKGMWEMILGGWRACIEPGDGMGYAPALSDDGLFTGGQKPFIADAIIANPPSFGHIHCAEKLGVPLHLMFTMPWSPTQAFPHPLANIQSSNAENSVTNFLSYALVEMMTWQGLGDLVNRLRVKTLGLEPISTLWAPGMISRLKVPYTYCWSPALIPKPQDWPSQIDISGFFFLSLASSYTPPPDLARFLEAGPPPVYIGFGSIVVDDPNAMTEMILQAVRLSGVRALVSQGWGGIGGDELDLPEGVMLLGNCPHDWLFPRCSAVVHHGGAGTTAAGISSGTPTVVVPFFGDQPFWGAMIARAGAGPEPVAYKELTAEILAESIKSALSPETMARAKELGESIRHESGAENGAKSFHRALAMDPAGVSRCDIFPDRVAVWRIPGSKIKISTLAASILVHKGVITGGYTSLKLYRHKAWITDDGPWEPISGGAGALMGTIGSIMMGVGDIPRETFKLFSKKQAEESQHEGGNEKGKGKEEAKEQDVFQDEKASKSTSNLQTVPSNTSTSSSSNKRVKPAETTNANETITTAMQGTRQIVAAGMKSPMDFTMGLAQGFRNAPRLYGDNTLRPQEKVTGFQSGLRAATKEFGFGMYDGITGLVTQPLRGAREEGAAGLIKGFGKGIGGVVLKPGAGFWGIPGYTMKGIHQEYRKLMAPNVNSYITSARIAQGELERAGYSEAQMNDIVRRWYELQSSRGTREPGFRSMFGAFREKGKGKGKEKERDTNKRLADASPQEFEQAIQQTVAATSSGNSAEDEAVERALRASVAELQRPDDGNGEDEDEDEALGRAIRASIAGYSGGTGSEKKDKEGLKFEQDLEEAFRQSLFLDTAPQGIPPPMPPRNTSAGLESRQNADTGDEDEDMKRAIRESLAQTESQRQHEQLLEELDSPSHTISMVDSTTDAPTPDTGSGYSSPWDAENTPTHSPKSASSPVGLAEPRHEEDQRSVPTVDNEEDEELKAAMQESIKVQEDDERRRREEEEIVLKHVMRQSMLEEESRRRTGNQ